MNSKRILTLILTAVILNLAAPARPQTYYLDAVNGDDTAVGSRTEPWQSLDRAVDATQPGDKVILADGHYGNFTHSLTNRYDGQRTDSLLDTHVGWITFEAKAGHNPVLDEVNFKKTDGPWMLAYWLKGLKCQKVKLHGVIAFNMENCEIVGSGDDIQNASGGYISMTVCSNISIQNCKIHFCPGTSISINSSSHVSILDSEIYDVGSDHLTFRTSYDDCYNVQIINNTIRDTIYWDSSSHPDGAQFYAAEGYNFRNCVFARNTMYNMAVQGLFIHGRQFIDGLIENNLIYSCGSRPVVIFSTTDTIFRNNTIRGRASFDDGNPNLQIYNNIFCGPYSPDDISVLGYHDYNIYVEDYKDWLKDSESHTYMYPEDQKSVMKSELFNDPDNGDYSLKGGCLAVDFCPASPAVENDMLEMPRDSRPDAGCYEFTGTKSPTINLSAFLENWLSSEPSHLDTNADGKVNFIDYAYFSYEYRISPSPIANLDAFVEDWLSEEHSKFDLNGDGKVNFIDYAYFSFRYRISPSLTDNLKAFVEDWLCEEPSDFDFNDDGKVNLVDYAYLVY